MTNQTIANKVEINLNRITNAVAKINATIIALAYRLDTKLNKKIVMIGNATEDIRYEFDKRYPGTVMVTYKAYKEDGTLHKAVVKHIDTELFIGKMEFEEAAHLHANTPAYWK